VIVTIAVVWTRRRRHELKGGLEVRLRSLAQSQPEFFTLGTARPPRLDTAVETLSDATMGDEMGIAWSMRKDVMDLWVLEREPVRVIRFTGSEIVGFEYQDRAGLFGYTMLVAKVERGGRQADVPIVALTRKSRYVSQNGRQALVDLLEKALRDGEVPEGDVDLAELLLSAADKPAIGVASREAEFRREAGT
jgi:hypothetical protein